MHDAIFSQYFMKILLSKIQCHGIRYWWNGDICFYNSRQRNHTWNMSQFQHSFQAGGASQFMVQVRFPSHQNIILSRSSLPQYFLCKTDFMNTILFLRRLEMRNITMWDSVRGRRRCAILFQLRSNFIWIITFWLNFTSNKKDSPIKCF